MFNILSKVLGVLRDHWKIAAALSFLCYVLFLDHKVNKLSRENRDLREALETEQKVSAFAETEAAELSSLMQVYYESRFDALQSAHAALDEANRAEDARFTTEVEDLRRRQRNLREVLKNLGESDPDALTCEFAKKFNLPGCIK
jgi:hypothetical protein